MIATIPPMSIHIALSVGEPVKNREMSELNEFVAETPMTIRAMPHATIINDISLFIVFSFEYFCLTHESSYDSAPADDSKEKNHDGNHQESMNQAARGIRCQ
jgi:hypothetical protein